MFNIFGYFWMLLLTLACCSIYGQDTKTITIGTNAEFAPFSYREDGKIVGFDIDIAKEVAKRLGKEPQFKDMPFDALIPDVILGNVDFVAAGMTYTEERGKRVAFTKPYLTEDPFVIMTLSARKGGPLKSIDDLVGKTVIVNEGFTADVLLSSKPGINLVRLSTTPDAFLALVSGRADAFVTAMSTADSFLATQDASKFTYTVIEGTAENCALIVSKKYPKMLADIQLALDAMEQDGTLAQIKTKWGMK